MHQIESLQKSAQLIPLTESPSFSYFVSIVRDIVFSF